MGTSSELDIMLCLVMGVCFVLIWLGTAEYFKTTKQYHEERQREIRECNMDLGEKIHKRCRRT